MKLLLSLPDEILLDIVKYLPLDLHGIKAYLLTRLDAASPVLLRDITRLGRDLIFRDREFSLRQVARILCEYLKFSDLPNKTWTIHVNAESGLTILKCCNLKHAIVPKMIMVAKGDEVRFSLVKNGLVALVLSIRFSVAGATRRRDSINGSRIQSTSTSLHITTLFSLRRVICVIL
jgi:hypothetical protein